MSTSLTIRDRTVSAIDADGSVVTPWPITGAVWISLGATCATASGAIAFRLICTDDTGVVTGVTRQFGFTSAAGAPDWGAVWLGTPASDFGPAVSVAADRLILKVDDIVGTWTIAAQTFCPAPPA
jgi:hypothetical protein